jgi:hypothetical protein
MVELRRSLTHPVEELLRLAAENARNRDFLIKGRDTLASLDAGICSRINIRCRSKFPRG